MYLASRVTGLPARRAYGFYAGGAGAAEPPVLAKATGYKFLAGDDDGMHLSILFVREQYAAAILGRRHDAAIYNITTLTAPI